AEIVRWNFNEGQSVTPDDDVVELVTDKAVFNVPADACGTISRIYYREGQQVPIGAVLADLEENFSGAPDGVE
ncbi:MAG: lipoyl domain-containing protein, partial [Candidatus Omnitrophota bacterium]